MHPLQNEFQQHCCYGQKNCHEIEFRQAVCRVSCDKKDRSNAYSSAGTMETLQSD